MSLFDFRDGNAFENEIRSIARQLWPGAPYSGSLIVNGRERDGIFVLEDSVHCIECTISREEKNASDNLRKLRELIALLRRDYPQKAIKGWYITLNEATAHQAIHIRQHVGVINHLSYEQFRSKIIDSRAYLSARSKYPFGSARNIRTSSIHVDRSEFIEVDIFPDGEGKPNSVAQLYRLAKDSVRSGLEGDFSPAL